MACRYVVERRMRVVTKAMHVAQSPGSVYEQASPACILCLLMHKISRAAAEEGVWNARQLLQDWLVRALANYNTNIHPKPVAGGAPLQVSVTPPGTPLQIHATLCTPSPSLQVNSLPLYPIGAPVKLWAAPLQFPVALCRSVSIIVPIIHGNCL